MQKQPLIVLSILALFAMGIFGRAPSSAYAASGTSTPPVQKALESAKAYIDDLVTAKDDNAANDTTLRIETFKQVLDLSSAEAKDYEYKLLTIDKDDAFEPWKQQALDGLTKALVYYDSERSLVSDPSSVDAAKIKRIAEDFKSWRDATYIPLVTQIQDFILLKQEAKAIQIASLRLQKINENLSSLGYAPQGKHFGALVASAGRAIADAANLNRKAATAFVAQYVVTSTNEMATGTATSIPIQSATSTPSSTAQHATSTLPSQPAISIKDVIRSSLDRIKGAYQNFIDISNLVRKLLGQ